MSVWTYAGNLNIYKGTPVYTLHAYFVCPFLCIYIFPLPTPTLSIAFLLSLYLYLSLSLSLPLALILPIDLPTFASKHPDQSFPLRSKLGKTTCRPFVTTQIIMLKLLSCSGMVTAGMIDCLNNKTIRSKYKWYIELNHSNPLYNV